MVKEKSAIDRVPLIFYHLPHTHPITISYSPWAPTPFFFLEFMNDNSLPKGFLLNCEPLTPLAKKSFIQNRPHLSKWGRLTLVKSTLSSLPIYFMSLFIIPHQVSLRLEKIQRGFLWGGGVSQSRPHLVNWSIVCMEKKDGGLDIRNLSSLNKTLFGKWCWRFASKQDSLWKQVIVGKYGEEMGDWCSGASREGCGVGLWKAISNGGWMEFSKRVAFKVGNGRRVWF